MAKNSKTGSRRDRPPGSQPQPPEPHEPTIHFEGLDVHLTHTRRFIVSEVGGGTTPVTSEKHKEHPAAGLMAEAPTPEDFCASSIEPSPPVPSRLPDAGQAAARVRNLKSTEAYDTSARVRLEGLDKSLVYQV